MPHPFLKFRMWHKYNFIVKAYQSILQQELRFQQELRSPRPLRQ